MNSNPASLAIEALEPKLAPAGTIILATTAAGLLTITGDAAGNGISITDSPSTGLWTITDPTATGTTFVLNGVTQGAMFTMPAQNSIKAVMGDGNDTLRINPSATPTGMILSGGLNYSGGKDNDVFSIGSSGNNQSLQVNGATVLDGGDGNDSVTVSANALFANTVDIKLGAGNDALTFSNTGKGEHTFLKGLKIDSGTGDDGIGIASGRLDVSGGNLTITGKGQTALTQLVTLNPDFANIQGSVSMAMAAGLATFSLNSASGDQFRIGGNLTITGGAEADTLNLRYTVHVAGAITVDLKDGANSFVTNANSAIHAGSLTFKGGKGVDTVTLGATGSLDVLGALTLNLGAGDNSFNMGTGSFVAGSFNYTGGTDADTLVLSGASYLIRGNAAINTGAGTSNFTSAPTGSGAIGGNFLFTGGANFDNVTIDNAFSVGGSTVLDLKESQNVVTFETGSSAVLNSFLQKGGKGVDVLDIDGVFTARGAVTLNFGDGTDTFASGAAGELHAGSFNLITAGMGETHVTYQGTAFDVAGAAVFNLSGGNNSSFFTALSTFSTGSLTVLGGAGTDDFFVTVGELDVRGATVMKLGNGANTTSFTLTDGDFNGVFAYTGGTGADTLAFTNGALQIVGGLVFKGDTGSNQLNVTMDTATIGAVNYTGAKDNDFLVLGITAGTGTRTTVLGGVVANLAGGTNNAYITDTVVQGALIINSTATVEVDDFRLKESIFNGAVTFNMGAGNSFFQLDDTITRGPFLLNTGAGNDDVYLDAAGGSAILSTWFDKVTVNTGAGTDDLFIGNAGNAGNVFQRAVIIDGGTDTDTLTAANNTFNGGALQQSNIP